MAAEALGLRDTVTKDSVRRAVAAIPPDRGEPLVRSVLMSSLREALERPWVLDMDAAIKPLCGR